MAKSFDYWNHNVAYHKWILKHVHEQDTVLDVGCGDGLLITKLGPRCKKVIGLDTHLPSVKKAQERIASLKNTTVLNIPFESYISEGNSVDAVIFVASIHHMDMEAAIKEAKKLLSPRGKIIIVGIAKPVGIFDFLTEVLRAIPAKIGSAIHNENTSEQIGLPTAAAGLSYKQILCVTNKHLPNAKIRKGLYYRYLLFWEQD